MKMSVADLETRLVPFVSKIVQTMPTTLHKWIGGAMLAANTGKLEKFIQSQADSDGMVDTDEMKRLVDFGFASSGGEVVIPFGSDALESFGVGKVNVKLTKEDADQFFSSL